MTSSELSGFHRLSLEERLSLLKAHAQLTDQEIATLKKQGTLDLNTANNMIENVVGTVSLPLGIATNFRVNGKEYLIPMAVEEPSIVAGASYAAKLTRPEGFTATAMDPVMIGQIQLLGIGDPPEAAQKIEGKKQDILNIANIDSAMAKRGGGLKDLECRIVPSERGAFLVVHLLIDVRDAMGANAVNTMAERLAPELEKLTGGEARLRILSNLAVHRRAQAKAIWTPQVLEREGMAGGQVIEAILDAAAFARADPYRAATNNKGIMNGVDAVAIATGNDFRALEAGAHAFASLEGYQPLATYEKVGDNLVGTIDLPIAVGTVGGSIKTNPTAAIALKILGVSGAQELAQVMSAVGLAQNFAAVRALATEGIQRGHMRLHAKNLAITAGATGQEIDAVVEQLVAGNDISVSAAQSILASVRETNK